MTGTVSYRITLKIQGPYLYFYSSNYNYFAYSYMHTKLSTSVLATLSVHTHTFHATVELDFQVPLNLFLS